MLAQGQEDRRAETTDLFVPTSDPLSVKESRKKEAVEQKVRHLPSPLVEQRCLMPQPLLPSCPKAEFGRVHGDAVPGRRPCAERQSLRPPLARWGLRPEQRREEQGEEGASQGARKGRQGAQMLPSAYPHPCVRTRVASTRALILFRAPTRQAKAKLEEEQASGQEDNRGGRLLKTGTSTLAAAASQGIWGTLKARRQPSHRTALNK